MDTYSVEVMAWHRKHEQRHVIDGLVTPLCEYMSYACVAQGRCPSQLLKICTRILALYQALEDDGAVEEALNDLLTSFTKALFSPAGVGVGYSVGGPGGPRGLWDAARGAQGVLNNARKYEEAREQKKGRLRLVATDKDVSTACRIMDRADAHEPKPKPKLPDFTPYPEMLP